MRMQVIKLQRLCAVRDLRALRKPCSLPQPGRFPCPDPAAFTYTRTLPAGNTAT